MLSRLDSQLDRSNYSISSSLQPLPSQLTGEPAGPAHLTTTATTTSNDRTLPLPATATATAHTVSRPPLSASVPASSAQPSRVSLSTVVRSLVESWSLAFLDLAKSGDGPSMLLVAQMYIVEKGYGAIKYDRAEGVRWLLRCVEMDEGESREMCRRLCPVEYSQWMEERRRRSGGEEQLRREQEMAAERQRADCAPSERAQMSNRANTATFT